MAICELPTDMIREINSYLDVYGSSAFRSTCSTINNDLKGIKSAKPVFFKFNDMYYINIKTNNNSSSSRILLREITNIHNISNKTIFDNTSFTTTGTELVDLSNSFFNTITICNNNTNVLVNVKTTLYCSYAYKERITVELWKDSSILIQDCSIGIINSTNGLAIPYNLTYLDENLNSGTIKYYLKYKLEKNITGQHMGIINVKTSLTNGSSGIILRQI